MSRREPVPPVPEFRVPPAAKWGFAFGGALCFLGLVILAVAFGQALRATRRGVVTAPLPGTTAVELQEPGVYVGLYNHKAAGPPPLEGLALLNITLAEAGGGFLPIQKAPSPQPFQQAGRTGALLFQCEVLTPGRYVLTADYGAAPGPAGELLLVHESLQNNRSDIAVGAILFLVLCGCGLTVLVRSYRGSRAAEREHLARLAASQPRKKK